MKETWGSVVQFFKSIVRSHIVLALAIVCLYLPSAFACNDVNGINLQTAITNAENAGGGTVTLGAYPSTSPCSLGTTSLVFAAGKGNVRLVGQGKGATTITYSGGNDAIDIGNWNGTLTPFVTLENLTVDISGGYSACTSEGIHAVETYWLELKSVEVKTVGGGSACSPGQIGVNIDGSQSGKGPGPCTGGGCQFTVYTTLLDPTIRGNFLTGLLVTGNNIINSANATTVVGGSISGQVESSPGVPNPSGEGITISWGDSTRVLGTDITGWQYGVHIVDHGANGAANSNGPIAARFEVNRNDPTCGAGGADWLVDAGVHASSFVGSGFACYLDNSGETAFSSDANGGVTQTKVRGNPQTSSLTSPVAATACAIDTGTGDPNSNVIGSICDIYLRNDGTTSHTLYVKESGTLTNTGWVGK